VFIRVHSPRCAVRNVFAGVKIGRRTLLLNVSGRGAAGPWFISPMKLSDMREILAKRDIQLTKSLGQNFLHDENQLRKIVEAAELTKADKVLEIGPGLGPLTELLLENAGEVLAIEKDARLVEILRERFNVAQTSSLPAEKKNAGETPALLLIHDDALRFLEKEKRDWSDWKLISNLPYSVASPILVELACGARAPKRIVVTLQLEVARRLMAQTDDDDYGILTLLVQLDFAPRTFFKIPPGSFFPEPDVDSACVILERRAQPLLPENLRANFVKIVKRAFSQRRKMMLKLLKADWPQEKLTRAFAELKISPQERAEKLSLEQFVALTEQLSDHE
jgi:16S rRNA (adenine1518-N6/adenine1519-N6)-dimethyltransferase